MAAPPRRPAPPRPRPPGGAAASVGRLLTALCLLLAAGGAVAQSASAVVSDRAVRVGETVTYTLTLDGGTGAGVDAPLATGALRLVSPQPTLDVTTTVGGQTQRRVAWLYEGARTGTGRVGGLRLRLGGRTLTVDPVAVTVTAGAPLPAQVPSGPARPGAELFVRAEPSRETAVVGQQVVVDYVLYFEPHVQPRQTAPIGTWDAAGFWREELDVPTAYPRTTTVGGRAYEAVTIRRVALFPTRAGTLSLSPMEFTVDLLRTDRRVGNDPFAPFFSPFSQRYVEEEVTAPSVEIAVRELPPAPPGFGGAVGQFTLRSEVDRRSVNVGEPVEVAVTVAGTGNVATLAPPDLDVPASVDVYGPEAERDVDRRALPLRGTQTFRWTLVPQGGDVEVPPATWTYFDPVDGTYKTLRTERFEIAVRGGVASADAPAAAGVALRIEADWQRPAGSTVWLWVALGGGLALPALAALALLAVRAGRERRAADTPERRRRRAGPALRRRLGAAEGGADVERAVRAFLADRFGAAAHGRRLYARLDEAGVPADARARLRDLLDACARAQFAPGLGPDVATLRAEAEAVLGALADRPARVPTLRRVFGRGGRVEA